MDSCKTKAKGFVINEQQQCIAEIIALPENGMFRIYVAWEWQEMADKQIFGFAKSTRVFPEVNASAIQHTIDYGFDIGGTDEVKKIFKNIV